MSYLAGNFGFKPGVREALEAMRPHLYYMWEYRQYPDETAGKLHSGPTAVLGELKRTGSYVYAGKVRIEAAKGFNVGGREFATVVQRTVKSPNRWNYHPVDVHFLGLVENGVPVPEFTWTEEEMQAFLAQQVAEAPKEPPVPGAPVPESDSTLE